MSWGLVGSVTHNSLTQLPSLAVVGQAQALRCDAQGGLSQKVSSEGTVEFSGLTMVRRGGGVSGWRITDRRSPTHR